MDYQGLGTSGLQVSALCLGTMMFGGPTDEPTASRIIDSARDAGINFIDTADGYNAGRSEMVLGRALAKDRDRWIVAQRYSIACRHRQPGRGTIRTGGA